MKELLFKKEKIIILLALVLSLVALIIALPYLKHFSIKNLSELKDQEIKRLIAEGKYRCCLEKPCSYCFFKYQKCDCLDKIVNKKAPCGECLGEILEGEGNLYLVKYFPEALTEKLGKEYKKTIEKIIAEKYPQAL